MLPGRPLIITGRYDGAAPRTIRVRGRLDNQPVAFSVPVNAHADARPHPALPTMWARTLIADLTDAMAYLDDDELPQHIERTALAANLVSRYTSFIAVDSSRITDGDRGVTVQQPLNIPEGTSYETQVGR